MKVVLVDAGLALFALFGGDWGFVECLTELNTDKLD